jgi:hypothetical protein
MVYNMSLFGSTKATSIRGSIVNFYAWIDPNFSFHPLDQADGQWMAEVSFEKLNRLDQISFIKCIDHVIYSSDELERLFEQLKKDKWTLHH